MRRLGLLLLVMVGSLGAQPSRVRERSGAGETPVTGNPSALTATQLLQVRRPGAPPRVRFSWRPVPRCEEYVLTGRWTDAHSWVVRSQEFRVTARTATRWEKREVAFDVPLAEGSHSWQVVAVFGAAEAGDYANPARVSFAVR